MSQAKRERYKTYRKEVVSEGYSGDDFAQTDSEFTTGSLARKKAVEQDVLSLARERIDEAYKLFDTIVVAFSGGKDSTICLHLTLEAAQARGKPLIVYFFDEEAIPFQTEEYVRRVTQTYAGIVDMRWLCIPIQHRNACTRKHPYWWPWAPEDEAKWVRPLPKEAITYLKDFPEEPMKRPTMPDAMPLVFPKYEYGRTAQIMGIRAEESVTRLRAVLRRSPDTRPYIRPALDNLMKVYPIYDWTTQDVWTAPNKFGWDYNKAYDAFEYAGISHAAQRCAPPFGEEPMQSLWMFKVCFPEIWDKMHKRVPGAATGSRYSKTPLYGFGGLPKKPDGMTYPAFVKSWVEKHPQPYRSEIAERVKYWIENHYIKTAELIAPTRSHPDTGISWRFLLRIAMRGDYKDRQQPRMGESREQYDAEIAKTPAAELLG